MSVRLRGKRHEASDTTSIDRIYFPPGSIGFWRETLIPGGEECGPFREPAGWAVFLVARGSEVQLSYACTGSERCTNAVPLLLTGVLLWIVLASPAAAQESQPSEPTTGKQTTSSQATSTSNNHPRSPEASGPQKPPVEKKHHDRGVLRCSPSSNFKPCLGLRGHTGSCLYLPSELARQDITSFRHWGRRPHHK